MVCPPGASMNFCRRWAFLILGPHRPTQRIVPTGRADEARLTADIIWLARQYGRYGYRKIAALLRRTAGCIVNNKRFGRIWRREGLKVPAKQPKRGRLWLNDGSCVRLRAEYSNHTNGYSDRPTCAHSLIPLDLMVSKILMRLFDASQIASLIAS